MTLKEELELLRGEPIEERSGNPMDIPCIETSDPERLCKNPVVSVHMTTYNHEPYIRQAIEGVMMQKTDFEFELVIGEDCSTDKTREICFEYQKKYPDKIRVLWGDHNLYRHPHPAGGNGARNLAHCRGEFIAYCEGDDYWIDDKKLQKQVDVFRDNETATMCFTDGVSLSQATGEKNSVVFTEFKSGVIDGTVFMRWLLVGVIPGTTAITSGYKSIYAPSVMWRMRALVAAKRQFDVFRWKLFIGDTPMWLGLASLGPVVYIPDKTVMYRIHAASVSHNQNGLKRIQFDGDLVRLYFVRMVMPEATDYDLHLSRQLVAWHLMGLCTVVDAEKRRREIAAICSLPGYEYMRRVRPIYRLCEWWLMQRFLPPTGAQKCLAIANWRIGMVNAFRAKTALELRRLFKN